MSRLEWTSEWETAGSEDGLDTPYVDFDARIGGISPALRAPADKLVRSGGGIQALRLGPIATITNNVGAVDDAPAEMPEDPAIGILADVLRAQNGHTAAPPLAPEMVTRDPNIGTGDPRAHHIHWEHLVKNGALPDFLTKGAGKELPQSLRLEDDTVIVGVIDLGIGLGHQRTRMENGDTRILCAWQQSADRTDLNDAGEQLYLPFGRELYPDDINGLIRAHSGVNEAGKPPQDLDEEAFNRATFTENYQQVFGQREAGTRASHGMHTLDLAGGLDPAHPDDPSELVRLMVTNFPDRALVGHSAVFLEYFAVFAIWRMIRVADAIWDRNHEGDEVPDEDASYPMVINLSFGKQASSRDGNDLIARVMKLINAYRTDSLNRRPVVLSIPAGNENLEQGNSKFVLSNGAEQEIEWRIPPGDLSANFVEVWTEPVAGVQNQAIEIELTTPTGEKSGLSVGTTNSVKDLYQRKFTDGSFEDRVFEQPDLVARIYCDFVDPVGLTRKPQAAGISSGQQQKNIKYRQRYVLAVKQTLLYDQDHMTAPAGVWKITVRSNNAADMRVELNVQTDQSANPVTAVNQRSYFEDGENYKRFDETGRRVDTYDYPALGDTPKSLDSSNVVRRHGTLNAVGISPDTATVAGHRASDGKPEPYSSTGFALPPVEEDLNPRREEPTVSYPSRDGAAHFGVLASGARDGSVAALQGTSFSAAMATRDIWKIMLHLKAQSASGKDRPDVLEVLRQRAVISEGKTAFKGAIARPKAGNGRVQHPQQNTLQMGRSKGSRFGVE